MVDDLLQWSAAGLMLLALLAIAGLSGRVQQRRSLQELIARPTQFRLLAEQPEVRHAADPVAIGDRPETPSAEHPPIPTIAITLTYRGVPYLRWR